jgi:hypothetical protein
LALHRTGVEMMRSGGDVAGKVGRGLAEEFFVGGKEGDVLDVALVVVVTRPEGAVLARRVVGSLKTDDRRHVFARREPRRIVPDVALSASALDSVDDLLEAVEQLRRLADNELAISEVLRGDPIHKRRSS